MTAGGERRRDEQTCSEGHHYYKTLAECPLCVALAEDQPDTGQPSALEDVLARRQEGQPIILELGTPQGVVQGKAAWGIRESEIDAALRQAQERIEELKEDKARAATALSRSVPNILAEKGAEIERLEAQLAAMRPMAQITIDEADSHGDSHTCDICRTVAAYRVRAKEE